MYCSTLYLKERICGYIPVAVYVFIFSVITSNALIYVHTFVHACMYVYCIHRYIQAQDIMIHIDMWPLYIIAVELNVIFNSIKMLNMFPQFVS